MKLIINYYCYPNEIKHEQQITFYRNILIEVVYFLRSDNVRSDLN